MARYCAARSDGVNTRSSVATFAMEPWHWKQEAGMARQGFARTTTRALDADTSDFLSYPHQLYRILRLSWVKPCARSP